MAKELNDLFWKWSQEVLQKKFFKKCHDNAKWAEYVRTPNDWKLLHNQFIAAVYEKWNYFEAELRRTVEGREKLIQRLEIGNEGMIKNIRAGPGE